MKKVNIAYWITTGLLAAFMLFSAYSSVLVLPDAVAIMTTHLGYPTYIIPFLGVAKVLGVIAILVPGFPRLKEWAYAGFVIDLAGAMYSTIKVGDPFMAWVWFFLFFALVAASYILYHKRLKAAVNGNTK